MFLDETLKKIGFGENYIKIITNQANYSFYYEPRNNLIVRLFELSIPGTITHFTYQQGVLVLEVNNEPLLYLEWVKDVYLVRQVFEKEALAV